MYNGFIPPCGALMRTKTLVFAKMLVKTGQVEPFSFLPVIKLLHYGCCL